MRWAPAANSASAVDVRAEICSDMSGKKGRAAALEAGCASKICRSGSVFQRETWKGSRAVEVGSGRYKCVRVLCSVGKQG